MPAREGEELRGADVLAAQGEHVVLVERALELGEVGVRQGLGEIDAVGLDAEAGELLEADHFRNSGEMSRGRNRMISGKKMVAARTPSIGISMIMTSFITYISLTLAIAHEIIRHRP